MSSEVWTDVLNWQGAVNTTEHNPLLVGSLHLTFNSVVPSSGTPLQARYSNYLKVRETHPHKAAKWMSFPLPETKGTL